MGNEWFYQFESQFPFAALEYSYHSPEGELHQHDYLEIAYCQKGNGNFIYRDSRQAIQPGDIFFLDQYYDHVAVAKDSNQPLTLVLLLFSTSIMNTIWLNNNSHALLEGFWRQMGRSAFKVPGDSLPARQLGGMIEEINTLWKERPQAWQLLLDGQLKVLLARCIQYYAQQGNQSPVENIQRRMELEPVLEYIHQNSHKKISLQALCAMAHMSETQFRQRFKQATSLNVSEYLDRVRISKAIRLLAATELSVKEISLEAGFSNTNRFYTVFRSMTGLSPADYRKKAETFRYYQPDFFDGHFEWN